jgi:hypothetical protein
MILQLLLHTTLFVDGNAVSYKIYYDNGQQRYYFKPGYITTRYPAVHVYKANGSWRIEGSSDQQFCRQVIEDVDNVVELKHRPLL